MSTTGMAATAGRTRARRSWEDWCADARAYYEAHGDLRVPARYVTAEGYKLGMWIQNIRRRYNAASPKCPLSRDEIASLEAIGMEWQVQQKTDWMALATRYYQEHGDLRVPQAYVTPEGHQLGTWISNMRAYYGRMTDQETRQAHLQEIQALEAIGMVWRVDPMADWMRRASRYYQEHGHLRVPQTYVTPDGHALGTWITYMRRCYNHPAAQASRRLSQAEIAALEKIGMVWRAEQAG